MRRMVFNYERESPQDLHDLGIAARHARSFKVSGALPLAFRAPAETSRALPNGRGFLRALPGGKGAVPSAPQPNPTAPAPAAPSVADVTGQLDLLSWYAPTPAAPPVLAKPLLPKGTQLSLFGEPDGR